MNKKILLAVLGCMLSFNAYAEEATTAETKNIEENKPKGNLRANLKRVALELSSVEVKNSEQYQDSPVSALNADSQTLIKGVLDFVLEYEREKWKWDNSVYLGYGKTTIKPQGEPKTETENEDMILFTTDYSYKMWKYNEADVGPFANIGYQTEFSSNDDAPRNKVIRGKTGIRMFNHKYFDDLYAAIVGEYDLTYSDDKNSKLAWELGAKFKYNLREGIDFKLEGYYRDYLSYSEYVGTDLKYDLNLTGRMEVKLVDNLSLSPFMSYRFAKSREASKTGSNFMIGISLSYSNLYNIW